MAEKSLHIITSFEDFISSHGWNDVELQYMLETLCSKKSLYPFTIIPAENVLDGLIMVYEPTGEGLLLTIKSQKDYIRWIEKTHFFANTNKAYLSWKNAIRKESARGYLVPQEQQYADYFDNCLAVFQGGGCKAIAYIGAYEVAYNRGVIFNELAGTSAGSIIAALIAAGATPKDLQRIVYEIFIKKEKSFVSHPSLYWVLSLIIYIITPILWILTLWKPSLVKQYFFIPLRTLWKKKGMFPMENLESLIEKELQHLTGLRRTVLFKDLTSALHIVASDIETKKEVIWNTHSNPDYSVAKAVCASCAYPLFFQPIDGRYVDGGLLSNTPNHIFSQHVTYNKVLSFQLNSYPKKNTGFLSYINKIVNTVVDGAVSIQTSLGQHAVYPITIDLKMDLDAIDFDKINKDTLPKLLAWGRETTETFFQKHDRTKDSTSLGLNKSINIVDSTEKMYALIASYSREHKPTEIHISTQDSTWAWILFPTILKWRIENTTVIVYLPKDLKSRPTQQKYEDARRRLLEHMGCYVKEEPTQNKILGFFAKADDSWSGVFYQEKGNPDDNGGTQIFRIGKYYDDPLESKVIQTWVEKLRNTHPEDTPLITNDSNLFSISHCSDQQIYDILKTNAIYKESAISISYQNIAIEDVYFLSNYIRLEKYRQINVLFDLYNTHKIPLFVPIELTLLRNKRTIVTPIILERHNNQLYVIEGKTRLKYAYQHHITHVNAVIIDGVTKHLPIEQTFTPRKVSQVMVTDNKKAENLKCIQLYRHIEETFHPSDTHLIKEGKTINKYIKNQNIMLNEDDRKALDAMDTQTVVLLASKVEDFINEADRLLNAYPTVDYNNVFDTALQLGNLANSLRDFSEKVWGAFSKIFGDYQPSVQRKFGMARMLVPEAMSEYGTLRNALAKKRDILDEFKNDLKAYLEQ